ncbi:myoD family inhibitor domain-containing protein [Melanotaenia boesemani]|uniref:myoD family inhibitor domain-containing protein n=1 Tax=Melanotaenia boesemani TaxID=1250792 RepID=UPI001C05B14D|nr:myoD family inhibitor domain-containing protein [Melanotaenia boesemani]XP_041858831.1 myoD family inhibitor domain-containing protein [Melanotaenia boesemani]
MDVTSHHCVADNSQSECISEHPKANGKLPHCGTGEAPPPLSDRLDSLMDSSSSSNDIFQLLQQQKREDCSAPICSPPPPSCPSPCNGRHHQRTKQKCLSSPKSHASFRTDAAQIKEVAGDDCCVHCLLACLFCETLSMCSAVGECLACGVGGAGCCDVAVSCCCVEAACTEEACQAVLDCGMLENCCSSSDCLEVCLECCSICFPS